MVRIAALVLTASLAAGAQEKKPEAPSVDPNVAPAQKTGAEKPAAQKNAGPPALKPDPALAAAFQSSVGTWRCAGTMMLPPDMGGQQVKTRSQMIIRREVSGFAYSGYLFEDPLIRGFSLVHLNGPGVAKGGDGGGW